MMIYKEELPRFHFEYNGQTVMSARYTNVNGFASTIIAVMMFRDDETLFNWTTYWGGCPRTRHKRDCLEWVADNGKKLSTEDARYFFKELPIDLYRN